MPKRREQQAEMPRAAAAQRVLAPIPWAVMIVGLVISQIGTPLGVEDTSPILTSLLAVFFPVLIVRLILAAIQRPKHRLTLLLLIAGIVTWAAASISVNAAPIDARDEFPAPGEWLFVVSYLGLGAYLLRDVDRRQAHPGRTWLDIVIVAGGTACLASLLLVTPIRIASGDDGISLLLALTYPLADIALALVVLSQVLLQSRSDPRKSWMVIVSFILLAAADSEFALRSSASNYEFDLISYVLWGAAFALLVTAALRPEQPVIKAVPKVAGTPILVGAGLLAVAVLTIRPDDTLAYYVIPPAVLTLSAVAARLALALRDANRANDAFALSQTDDLTKLPNRRAVRSWLSQSLEAREPLALMLLDLDGFKEINDSLGHRAGDLVLTLVAVRLREAAPAEARIARLGGDEFAVLLGTRDEITLMESARSLLRELAKPIEVEGIAMSPAASIGLTLALPSETDDGEILRRADVAMYQAKTSGLGVALYDVQLDEFSRSRLQLAEDLRQGIAEGQIEIWYQPQVDVATMQVAGLEALVRWRHPAQGVISPVSFLPAARRAGLMGQLSQVVAEEAVREFEMFRRAGVDTPVAINCAPPELLGPTFLPHLYEAIQTWQVAAERIVLEITEDSFLADPQRTLEVLQDLRSHGVQISIDDYGTGFSSLAYLRNLPIQELKVDRTLIGNVASDHRSQMIVASTIQLAHALDLRIVAEGVENAADLDALAAMGIDVVQGYHLARPMPADEVVQWVHDFETSALQPAPAPIDSTTSEETTR